MSLSDEPKPFKPFSEKELEALGRFSSVPDQHRFLATIAADRKRIEELEDHEKQMYDTWVKSSALQSRLERMERFIKIVIKTFPVCKLTRDARQALEKGE